MKPSRHNRVLLLSLLFCFALLTTTCKKAIYAPGEGDTIQLQADTTTIAPGESVTITITGVKASGHPMPDNTLVQLTVDSGKFLDLEGNEIAAVQLISGTAKAIYQSDANFTGEAVTITARSGAALVNPEQLVITIASLEIVQLFMTANPLKLPPSGGTTVITVTAYNSQQEAVPGKKVFLETTAGTLTPSSPIITDSAGKVTASLTTTEPASVTATYREISKTIEIAVGVNEAPIAGFEFSPKNPLMGETVYFVSTSTDPDGTIISHHWDFGDGKPGSSEENPSHKFPATSEAKEYQVVLTVTDNGGKKSSVAQTVAFALKEENIPPTADFVFSPTNPQAGETVYFNAAASIDPNGKIESYQWNFGNNKETAPSDSPLAENEYNPPVTTTYTVTLRVVDDDGAEGIASKEVTVEVMIDENQPPTAVFSFSPKNPLAGEKVRFNAGASTDPDGEDEDLEYEWDFGDGDDKQEKTGINPTHTYDVDEEKTFTVTLTVVDKQGAEGMATAEITVRPTPVARFTFSPGEPEADYPITFDASTSEGDIQFYQWFFGDGAKANVNTPVIMHAYNGGGTYTVTLKVIDVNNRTSETSMKLTVK
jgi:PKD repeat protein